MIIYTISVNGEKLCEVGVQEEDQLEVALAKLAGDESGVLNLTALLPSCSGPDNALSWETYYVDVGDEVCITIQNSPREGGAYLDDYRPEEDETDPLRCSFCRKTSREVKQIVSGNDAFICNECIGMCVDILDTET